MKDRSLSKSEIENRTEASPSQQELNSLLALYRAAKYGDAKKLAKTLTEKFPKHHFPWKVLGAALKQMGKLNEALVVFQKSYFQYHNNV